MSKRLKKKCVFPSISSFNAASISLSMFSTESSSLDFLFFPFFMVGLGVWQYFCCSSGMYRFFELSLFWIAVFIGERVGEIEIGAEEIGLWDWLHDYWEFDKVRLLDVTQFDIVSLMKDNSLYILQVGIFTDPEPDFYRSRSRSTHFL